LHICTVHLYLDTILEIIGSALSLHGIWALTKGQRLGWLTGLFGILIMGVFCYLNALYGQVVLQVYFAVSSVYGWWSWQQPQGQPEQDFVPELMSGVVFWSSMVGLGLVWPACWYLLETLNGQAPGIDAFLLATSMVAQWWQTRKYIASWWLWVLVNVVSIVLFQLTGSYTYMLLYVALLLLAIRGALNWQDLARQHRQRQSA
jgi:nicotinamide mononucleotide transporter